MKKFVVLFLALLSFGGVSYSADTEVGPSDPVWLTEARAGIKAKKYDEAIFSYKPLVTLLRPIGII